MIITQANGSFTFPNSAAGQVKTVTLTSKDASGNDDTALCTFSVANGAGQGGVIAVSQTGPNTFTITTIQSGSINLIWSCQNASGTVTETDLITVPAFVPPPVVAPASLAVSYV